MAKQKVLWFQAELLPRLRLTVHCSSVIGLPLPIVGSRGRLL